MTDIPQKEICRTPTKADESAGHCIFDKKKRQELVIIRDIDFVVPGLYGMPGVAAKQFQN